MLRPSQCIQRLYALHEALKAPKCKHVLQEFDVELDDRLASLDGRILEPEHITLGDKLT